MSPLCLLSQIINVYQSMFQDSWNNHPLSSEGGRSPYQLLLHGLNHILSNYTYTINSSESCIDVTEWRTDHVDVPRLSFILCSVLIQTLDNLSFNSDFYTTIVEMVRQHLLSGYSQYNACVHLSYIFLFHLNYF